ncbi:hypothetical protein T459_24008 [Capsicum annuum]|uniref:NB-ARC domain-containing protein n=1 Tax=Capsicum annuum TaxID=4072 RepID=A0A2G2YU16_CAPAN|nr:hypothetical protein T459_24008 [Capsicum annuum]
MAYGAITSLMNIIQQSMQVTGCNLQSCYKKLDSIRAIMEKFSNIIGDLEALTSLEVEITQLAYKTQDMVDTELGSVSTAKEASTQRIDFLNRRILLKLPIGDIASMMNKWMEMENRYANIKVKWKAQNLTLASTSQHALEPENMMVGRENEFEMMQDQLAGGSSELEVVSIVVNVTQAYCARNVLLDLLSSISESVRIDGSHEKQDDGQLPDQLQKLLKGRRYLIVIDDIWAKDVWDDIKLCFKDCNYGSRILMTTRNMEVAEYVSSGKPPYQMHLLNSDESWCLQYAKVFVKDCFSPAFEQLGKQIALKCGGLPLAIAVIAGLLSKIGEALDEWRSITENVSSVVCTDLEVQCMRVLALSYHHLTQHLRACFLYFAIFLEDKLIFVSKLVKLWAAEGFLKLRYLALTFSTSINQKDIYIPSSVANLQYLQTFILKFPKYLRRPGFSFILSLEILTMSSLRHLSLDRHNLASQRNRGKVRDLGNLQCLSGWYPSNCSRIIGDKTGDDLKVFIPHILASALEEMSIHLSTV